MNYRMDSLTEAKITKILDGDTLKVTLPNGFIITVRLLLIDSPEYKRAIIDQQLYGYEALEFARNNLKTLSRLIHFPFYFSLNLSTQQNKQNYLFYHQQVQFLH